MVENLLKKQLPFLVYIPVLKGNIIVFCNILSLIFSHLSHENLLIVLKYNIYFNVINFVVQFLTYQMWQFWDMFSWNIFLLSANFFSNGLLYLVLWNVQINFFLVMVVMVTKKMVLLWFPWQWLWRKKIPPLISES